jgi:hypothetical protein
MYFPKEKEGAEKKAKKFALDYVKSNLIPVPDKNSLSTDPIRKNYDFVFQSHRDENYLKRESWLTSIWFFSPSAPLDSCWRAASLCSSSFRNSN